MATILEPVITDAGMAAAIAADAASIEIAISHISFGEGFYTPTGTETALQNEMVKVPVAAGFRVTPTQIRLGAIWQDETLTKNITEIGYWIGTTLFAIWSRASGVPVAIKTPGVDFVAFYDLALAIVPPNSVNVAIDPDANDALAALLNHEVDPAAHPQYLLRSQFARSHNLQYSGAATGSANALILASPPEQVVTSYATGLRLGFKASANNTGGCTVNVNGNGLKDIRKTGTAVLVAGDLVAGAVYEIFYDGTNFQLVGGLGSGTPPEPTVIFGKGTWKVAANGANLTRGQFFIPDNQSADCSYTMPPTPADGDMVSWRSSSFPFSVFKMTIHTSDKPIMGSLGDVEIIDDGVCGQLIYRAAINEWRAYTDAVSGETY